MIEAFVAFDALRALLVANPAGAYLVTATEAAAIQSAYKVVEKLKNNAGPVTLDRKKVYVLKVDGLTAEGQLFTYWVAPVWGDHYGDVTIAEFAKRMAAESKPAQMVQAKHVELLPFPLVPLFSIDL